VFLGNRIDLWTLGEFAEEVVICLMDDGSSHIITDMIGLLTKAKICTITFASHTFQILDVTLFRVL
jgi:hypothetical protein